MKTWVFLAVSLSLVVFAAHSIDAYNTHFLAEHGMTELNKDIFYKTFGEFKNYFSDMSYLKADIYYHGGIYHIDEGKDEHEHETQPQSCLVKETQALHEHEDIHDHKHEHAEHKIRPSLNILFDIADAMRITEHRHLWGKEEKEIVPWIYYAVRLNPHNEEAYSVGGFWLAVKLKKPDHAIKLLEEGLTNNPESWKIYQALGQVYFVQKKNYEKARTYFEKAKGLGDKEKVNKFDKRKIYTFLAESCKETGNEEQATELYRELLKLFPGDKTLEAKI